MFDFLINHNTFSGAQYISATNNAAGLDRLKYWLENHEQHHGNISLGTRKPSKTFDTFLFFLFSMTQKTGRNLFDFQPLTAQISFFIFFKFSFYMYVHVPSTWYSTQIIICTFYFLYNINFKYILF